MIAALTNTNLIVEILDTYARDAVAFVLNLGRENIGQHYVGGEGYKGTRAAYMPAYRFSHVALLPDDDPCVSAYLDIQHDVDRLAAEGSPDLPAARELEARAFDNLRAHIVTNSLPNATVAIETAPKPTPNSAVDPVVEVEHGADVHPVEMALSGSSGA